MNKHTAKIDKAIISKLTADYENETLKKIKERLEAQIERCDDILKSAPDNFLHYILNVYEWEAKLYYYDRLEPEIETFSLIAPTPEYISIFMDEVDHNSSHSENDVIRMYEVIQSSIRILHTAPQSERYMFNHVCEYHVRNALKRALFITNLIETEGGKNDA